MSEVRLEWEYVLHVLGVEHTSFVLGFFFFSFFFFEIMGKTKLNSLPYGRGEGEMVIEVYTGVYPKDHNFWTYRRDYKPL